MDSTAAGWRPAWLESDIYAKLCSESRWAGGVVRRSLYSAHGELEDTKRAWPAETGQVVLRDVEVKMFCHDIFFLGPPPVSELSAAAAGRGFNRRAGATVAMMVEPRELPIRHHVSVH